MSGTTIPLVMAASGPVPTSVTTLLSNITTQAEALAPGLTSNLPGSLVEDMTSTAAGALVELDQARVDAINSVTPYGANAFVLAQLGAQFGIPQGVPTNGSVYVVFTGPAGYVIPVGFTVGDGTYQYVVQDGGVITTGGTSAQLYAVASNAGIWAIPAASVTQLITSVPSGISLSVTNPQAGTPGGTAETIDSYRTRVLEAGRATASGTPAYVKALLKAVPGVNPLLVSVRQVPGGYEILCGGGDAYAVANAIYQGVLDLSLLQGSATTSRNVTATIIDGTDSYTIVFVNPPQQTVTVAATWNTQQANFTAASTVQQLAVPALQNYINGIPVGQPINLLEMQAVFQEAAAPILPGSQLTTLTFTVTINGSTASPTAGTSAIEGDPESYFFCSSTGATVTQG